MIVLAAIAAGVLGGWLGSLAPSVEDEAQI
jgi:hypothetical protein